MKRFYTCTLSTILALSVMLASAGVPLIAHMCNMGCKKEVSVLANDNCCKAEHPESTSSHLKKGPCCDSRTFFLKQELPATKTVKSAVPLTPVATILQVADIEESEFSFTVEGVHNNFSPVLHGRELLNHIQVLRT